MAAVVSRMQGAARSATIESLAPFRKSLGTGSTAVLLPTLHRLKCLGSQVFAGKPPSGPRARRLADRRRCHDGDDVAQMRPIVRSAARTAPVKGSGVIS